jgi:hypothetical protein
MMAASRSAPFALAVPIFVCYDASDNWASNDSSFSPFFAEVSALPSSPPHPKTACTIAPYKCLDHHLPCAIIPTYAGATRHSGVWHPTHDCDPDPLGSAFRNVGRDAGCSDRWLPRRTPKQRQARPEERRASNLRHTSSHPTHHTLVNGTLLHPARTCPRHPSRTRNKLTTRVALMLMMILYTYVSCCLGARARYTSWYTVCIDRVFLILSSTSRCCCRPECASRLRG